MSSIEQEAFPPGWRARWTTILLCALLVASLPVAYASPLAFAVIATVAGLLLWPTWPLRRSHLSMFALAGLLCGWAVASVQWSQPAVRPGLLAGFSDFERSTPLKLVLTLLLCTGLVAAADRLREKGAGRVVYIYAWIVPVLVATLAFEAVSSAWLYKGFRAAVGDPARPDLAIKAMGLASIVAAALFWPAALVLSRRGPSAAAVVTGLVLTATAARFGVFAAIAALLAGLIAYLLVSRAPRVGALVCAGGAALFTMVAPFAVSLVRGGYEAAPASWAARLDIWRFTAERVMERPWLGWGLDASRAFPVQISLHPHDAPLQMWLETGLVGAALFALLWAAIFHAAGRAAAHDRAVGGTWAATAASFWTIGALSFGVWQEWWLGLGAVLFAACLALRRAWPAGEPHEALIELDARAPR